jgi:hypothetical protein
LPTPSILIVLFAVHLILQPILIKKLTKSLISGSIAQFDNVVFPLAKHEAIIKFSVAPTDIFGNFIFAPIKPFGGTQYDGANNFQHTKPKDYKKYTSNVLMGNVQKGRTSTRYYRSLAIGNQNDILNNNN